MTPSKCKAKKTCGECGWKKFAYWRGVLYSPKPIRCRTWAVKKVVPTWAIMNSHLMPRAHYIDGEYINCPCWTPKVRRGR
jgi:hypothetical protein